MTAAYDFERLNAAHKRELAIKDAVIQTESAARLAEQERHKREVETLKRQLGNAAKLREALKLALSLLDLDEETPYKTVTQKDLDFIKASLAEPSRNCERFKTWDEAKAAFWREQGDPSDWRKLGAWLFAKAGENFRHDAGETKKETKEK